MENFSNQNMEQSNTNQPTPKQSKKIIVVSLIILAVFIALALYVILFSNIIFCRSCSHPIPQTSTADQVKESVFKTELAKCLGLWNGEPRLSEVKGFDAPVWIIGIDGEIEDTSFILSPESGKIIKVSRQVFDTQCLLADSSSKENNFCCNCINHNPLCAGQQEFNLTGDNIVNQIKQRLGNNLASVPNPGECEKVSNQFEKDLCLRNKALAKSDYLICNNVLTEPSKFGCYFQVARKTNNDSICGKIIIDSIKNICYNTLKNK